MIYKKTDGVPEFEATEYSEKKSRYCVCIPIINEGERIKNELGRAQKHGIDKICDIIICDGGSTDGCTEESLLRSLGVNTLLVKKSEGKQGAQLRMGMWWALKRGYDGIITVDGNDKDSVEDIPKFIEKLKEGYDFVQGSRFIKGGKAINTPPVRYISVRTIHAPVISATAGERFTDTTNAFRAYSKNYLKNPQVKPFRDIFPSYELLAYLSVRASQLGMKTCEIPVIREYPKNEKMPTKISFFKGNSELMKILVKNYLGFYNPKSEKPKPDKKVLVKNLFVFAVFLITLFMGFYSNSFAAANQNIFDTWQIESESLVIGKIQHDKILPKENTGGFLMCIDITKDFELQKNSYISGQTPAAEDYLIYTHQVGLQGKLYSFISGMASTNEGSLELCYVVNSILSAAAFAILLYLIYKRFGLVSAVFGWVLILFSPWLTIAGRNLYWCLWTMLLPMLCVMLMLELEEKTGREHNVFLFIVTALTVLIKSACGYEFISCVMVSVEVPLIYFAVKNSMNLRRYIKRACVIGFGAATGFISAVLIHLSASTSYYGDFDLAWKDFTANIVSRTGSGSSETEWMFVESLNAHANEVINTYLNSGEGILFGWRMGMLIPLFAVFAGLCFISEKYCKTIAENRKNLMALSAMTAVSAIAPISWFVLAKGHSYLHPHINYILWYLPFAVFGFALIGAVTSCIVREYFAESKKQKILTTAVCAVVCMFFAFFNNLHIIGNYATITELEKKDADFNSASVNVYYEGDKLYYIVDESFDISKIIYLRIVPTNVNDLIEGEREQGFNNISFNFEDKEIEMPNLYGKRVAMVLVPNYYEPERIRTGQNNGKTAIWDCSISPENT